MKVRSFLMPSTLLENFCIGMDRQVDEFKKIETFMLPVLNLGAGNKHIQGAESLDASTGWWAPFLEGYEDEIVGGVFAYHFLEHLDKATFLKMMKEIERVLVPGGLVNICVPYWDCELAHQDIDHKLFFSEKTFPNLFFNKYYDGTVPRKWKFKINAQVIMGIVHRNMCLMVQLEKVA